MGLIVNNAPGTDMNLDPDKVNAYKKFANKVWNITRFVLDNTHNYTGEKSSTIPEDDAHIRARLHEVVGEITEYMERDRFDLASEKIYHYVWHELADNILEASKSVLTGTDAELRTIRQETLTECLTISLKLLHPYMPFMTETIWQQLPPHMRDQQILMVAAWPHA